MTPEEYQNSVTRLVEDARRFMDDEISPDREDALNYLRGETDVPDPEPGFSSITSTTSRDSLHTFMRELMRLFAGTDAVVEFMPGEQDTELAEQQTDFANYTLMVRNGGWRVLHDTFRSAVGSGKVAGIKVVWSDAEKVWQDSYTELSDEEMKEFEDDPDADVIEHEIVDETEQIPIQINLEDLSQEQVAVLQQDKDIILDGTEIRRNVRTRTHNATVKFKKPANEIDIQAIMAEELLLDRRATDADSAKIVAQDVQRTRSDLIDLGMTEDFIDRFGGSGGSGEGTSQESQEKRARVGYDIDKDDDSGNVELTTYRLVDGWARIDKDGDGIAEWRHFLALGDHAELWEESDEMVSESQIATFIPFLVENTAIGETLHDLTKDIADTTTCLQRGMVDNLSLTNFPKPVGVEGQFVPASITNRRAVGIVKRPGAFEYLNTPYAVDGVLNGLSYFKAETASRIGVSQAAMGLDPDALQSSSDFGVRETFGKGSGGIEFVARNLAETGMKKVFRLIIQLYARHQKESEMIRLRGKVVEVNPRQFDSGMDLTVNVGLGTGQREAKTSILMFALQQQKETLASTPDGQENEITSPQQVVNTLDKILALHDIKNEGQFFKNPPGPPPPPPPDPAEAAAAAAQAEAEVKGQVEIQKAQIKAESDLQVALIQQQTELAKSLGANEAKALQDKINGQIKESQARQDALLKLREQDLEAMLEVRGQNIEAAKDIEMKNRELRSVV